MISSDEEVLCWGANDMGQLGQGHAIATTGVQSVLLTSQGTPRDIDVGKTHVCVVLSSGQIDYWGQNDQGQLGRTLHAFTDHSPMDAMAILQCLKVGRQSIQRAVISRRFQLERRTRVHCMKVDRCIVGVTTVTVNWVLNKSKRFCTNTVNTMLRFTSIDKEMRIPAVSMNKVRFGVGDETCLANWVIQPR